MGLVKYSCPGEIGYGVSSEFWCGALEEPALYFGGGVFDVEEGEIVRVDSHLLPDEIDEPFGRHACCRGCIGSLSVADGVCFDRGASDVWYQE